MPETPAEETLQAEQEWQQRTQRREDTCQDKTGKGNSYLHQSIAECVAARMDDKCAQNIQAYKCTVCPNWHVGKGSREFRKAQQSRSG